MFKSKIHYWIVLLLLCCSRFNSYSQFNTDFFEDTTQQLTFEFQANYSFGSTVMDNEFMNKFLFGGKIEKELKDRAYGRLSSNNRLGGDFNYRLRTEIPFDTLFNKAGLSMIVGLESRDHIDAAFTDELFKLTFDGNKQFASQTIDIGNTNFLSYKYQSLSFGLVRYKDIDGRIAKEGFVVSLIKGQQHEAITVPRGALYTEDLGRQIDIDINYIYNRTDTANLGLKAFNGFGISTDLFTEFYLKNGDKMYLGINDLGFIYWNNQSLELATDSSYTFDGIYINNIFDLNDSIVNKLSKDSIINTVATTNIKDDYSIALPTALNVNYTKQFNEKWKANLGLYHKILSNYFPLIYSNVYYYFNKKFSAKIQLAYGGYGKFNSGVALAKSFSKRFSCYIGTNNIEGFIMPDKAFTNSGFVGIKTYF